jgi:DNA-binding MarR family transcriptional regulator
MQELVPCDRAKDFLRSARVFAWSVREVFERQVLREVAGARLSFAQFKLLYFVAHTDTHTVGDAAAFLGVSKAAASKAVQKLVEQRLLRRVVSPSNRRSSQLCLTAASQRLLKEFQQARDRLAQEVFGAFRAAQLEEISEVLDRLAAAIAARSKTPDPVCLRCEVYFCQPCRFGEWGGRNCFYQGHARGRAEPSANPAEAAPEDAGLPPGGTGAPQASAVVREG